MPEPTVEILQASEVDYQAYAVFQREAYRDLLARSKATDAHMTPEYYRWKYQTPDGAAKIARITDGGETISSSAMLPLQVSFGEESVIGWHCVDVATLPAARRKGLFLATLRRLKETVSPEDVLFAFPNAGSIPSFLKLGFAENVILTTWINPCSWLVKGRDARIHEVDRFGADHDVVGGTVESETPFVNRRPAYLNWRYADHPNNTYVFFVYGYAPCQGICVARQARLMGRDFAVVMEVFGSTPNVQAALLSRAADWAHSAGLRMMALMSTSLPLRTAGRMIFAPVPAVFLPKRQVLVLYGSEGLPAALVTARWVAQTGDWDVL